MSAIHGERMKWVQRSETIQRGGKEKERRREESRSSGENEREVIAVYRAAAFR